MRAIRASTYEAVADRLDQATLHVASVSRDLAEIYERTKDRRAVELGTEIRAANAQLDVVYTKLLSLIVEEK